MSSRSIEGENPLYLPQAKVYAGSCALSTGIVPAAWYASSSTSAPTSCARSMTGRTSTIVAVRKSTRLIGTMSVRSSIASMSGATSKCTPSGEDGTTTTSAPNFSCAVQR